jgi:hypothetical protein
MVEVQKPNLKFLEMKARKEKGTKGRWEGV